MAGRLEARVEALEAVLEQLMLHLTKEEPSRRRAFLNMMDAAAQTATEGERPEVADEIDGIRDAFFRA